MVRLAGCSQTSFALGMQLRKAAGQRGPTPFTRVQSAKWECSWVATRAGSSRGEQTGSLPELALVKGPGSDATNNLPFHFATQSRSKPSPTTHTDLLSSLGRGVRCRCVATSHALLRDLACLHSCAVAQASVGGRDLDSVPATDGFTAAAVVAGSVAARLLQWS